VWQVDLVDSGSYKPLPMSETTNHDAAPPHGEFYIPSLDGLRAVACLLVFFGHAVPVEYSRFAPAGFGVGIFFFLSGYLITTLLRREFARSGTINLRHFCLRRVLRILPPFYLVLSVTTLLTALGVLSGRVELQTILAYALHIANYWHIWYGLENIPGGTSVYWSLSVEEHFYLVFPLLFLFMSARKLSFNRILCAILGLCLLVLLWRSYLVLQGVDQDRIGRATDTRVDTILFGCALAVFKNPMLDTPTDRSRWWLYLGLPLGLALLAVTFFVRNPFFHGALRMTVQAIALAPIFIAAIKFPEFGPFRLLNTRLFKFVGLISYTLYLIHRAILDFLWRHSALGWVPLMLLALGISVALSYLIYLTIEAPAARLRRRLTALPQPLNALPAESQRRSASSAAS